MRWFTILVLVAASISAFTFIENFAGKSGNLVTHAQVTDLSAKDIRKAALLSLKQHAAEAKSYTLSNHFNSRYCFMIDMQMPSGRKRFFVYDLENDNIIQSGLVTHGSGRNNPGDTVVYSNEPGSNCTSLGKYKIGKSYQGKFGLAYKLYGLDKTNSNAYSRFVVLHAHPFIPDKEIDPRKICTSWGCPTVSPSFLYQLKNYLDQSEKPILLWIYK